MFGVDGFGFLQIHIVGYLISMGYWACIYSAFQLHRLTLNASKYRHIKVQPYDFPAAVVQIISGDSSRTYDQYIVLSSPDIVGGRVVRLPQWRSAFKKWRSSFSTVRISALQGKFFRCDATKNL